MFDRNRPRVWRHATPPKLIIVDMAKALPALHSGGWAGRQPLWLRADGLRVEPQMSGELLAWVRFSRGNWIAKIRVFAQLSREPIELILWVSPDAITPRGQ